MHMLPALGINLGVDEVDHVNQILLTLRVAQEPMTAPLYLASLVLMYQVSNSFSSSPFSQSLFRQCSSLAETFTHITKYELGNMQNKVVDGTQPFPEDKQSQEWHFYRVIVGVNGSGKSTILKLISRVYDPTDGTILIDDQDIKTLKLADLRAAMSILFQGYSHFPVTIHENIGLGNPAFANGDEKIREAARLGGAEEFIDDLPDGLLKAFGGAMSPPSTSPLFQWRADAAARSLTHIDAFIAHRDRAFHCLTIELPKSALFERLKKWRGSKTMIFSTHRFGKLTWHADLILYMDESPQEQGTHDELMRKGGEYARIWNLQAMDFL
ncbi:P-loop containing nucleoside triphosphate hydrolase protein [Suillus fuscotomentosus]|uniref:P-loop containing nucleoside triphosphate hydrolase protein n=1 Tax=Suillus fuscotomentosus TaxID=1912939 RepID=A0AAD4HUG9_9AGAM|nr:P-loop containing nucleoside triphosphate hydrolase protein [Suillus fuscotomentosus]KAG1908606.1 P-loop containing nucleoside triphosphate hydrolase protein [Suillus fuscotomentosus]